jgi:hypothetical protein
VSRPIEKITRPRALEIDATLEEDPSQTMQLSIGVPCPPQKVDATDTTEHARLYVDEHCYVFPPDRKTANDKGEVFDWARGPVYDQLKIHVPLPPDPDDATRG